MYTIYVRGLLFTIYLLLSTYIIIIENLKIDVDVQITIMKFREIFGNNLCLPL